MIAGAVSFCLYALVCSRLMMRERHPCNLGDEFCAYSVDNLLPRTLGAGLALAAHESNLRSLGASKNEWYEFGIRFLCGGADNGCHRAARQGIRSRAWRPLPRIPSNLPRERHPRGKT